MPGIGLGIIVDQVCTTAGLKPPREAESESVNGHCYKQTSHYAHVTYSTIIIICQPYVCMRLYFKHVIRTIMQPTGLSASDFGNACSHVLVGIQLIHVDMTIAATLWYGI